MNQLKEDIFEGQVNSEELDDLDYDVKEATSGAELKSEWIELEASCSSYKNAIDVTCCKLKK